MTSTPVISVVVPTYQRCTAVHSLLQALCRQTLAADQYEVIVSVDGSEDCTSEMVTHFRSPYLLRCVWNPNRGRAAACNVGIRMADGDVVVLLDDDMEPLPGFLAAHQAMHRHKSRLGVLGAVPILWADERSSVVKYRARKFDDHMQTLAQPRRQIRLTDFYSGNFSLRREIFGQVGFFDEAFTIYGNEDLELFCRLRKASVEFAYCPEAFAYQDYTKDPGKWARDNIAEGRTSVLLACKHPETFADLILGTYYQGMWGRRLIRDWLLALARHYPRSVDWAMTFIKRIDQCNLVGIDKVYFAIEDYFYWLGVQSAVQQLQDMDTVDRFVKMWEQCYGSRNLPFRRRPVDSYIAEARFRSKA